MGADFELSKPPTIYLDQNILAHLRLGDLCRTQTKSLLDLCAQKGARYVVSDVHVEEIRAYHAPSEYVKVLDDIGAFFMHPTEHFGQNPKIEDRVSQELILAPGDIGDSVKSLISELHFLIQYILGWLGPDYEPQLKQEFTTSIDEFISAHKSDLQIAVDIPTFRQVLLGSIDSLDLNELRNDAQQHSPKTIEEWNIWYSAIDQLAPNEIVEYIFSKIEPASQRHLIEQYPKNRWADGPTFKAGEISGLALLLFIHGVGRDRTVKAGKPSKRKRRFQAQMRDCRHIEEAARCSFFLTADQGAADLAHATYAHLGIPTHIVIVETINAPG